MNKQQLTHVLQLAKMLCRKRGVRLTDQRKTVLQIICASDKPLNAYELLDRLGDVMKNPAPPTVYRALDFLLDQGLIHKLESLHAYVGCKNLEYPQASQFLICNDCGEVAEVEQANIAKSLKATGKTFGFHTKRLVIELLGTCDQCTTKSNNSNIAR